MKNVKVIRGCVADGVRLRTGDIVEISDKAFRELESRGRVAFEPSEVSKKTNLELIDEKVTRAPRKRRSYKRIEK